jgi:DNA mismatch repair protein MSH3
MPGRRSGLVESELEGALLALAPSEVVVGSPLSRPTQRLLSSYQANTPGCRLEVLDAGTGAGGSGTELDAEAQAELVAFYQGGGRAFGSCPAAAGDEAPPPPPPPGSEAALAFVLGLPPLVLKALHTALRFLQPFGLTGVLGLVEGFRRVEAASALRLGPNALRQLEVLAAGGGCLAAAWQLAAALPVAPLA